MTFKGASRKASHALQRQRHCWAEIKIWVLVRNHLCLQRWEKYSPCHVCEFYHSAICSPIFEADVYFERERVGHKIKVFCKRRRSQINKARSLVHQLNNHAGTCCCCCCCCCFSCIFSFACSSSSRACFSTNSLAAYSLSLVAWDATRAGTGTAAAEAQSVVEPAAEAAISGQAAAAAAAARGEGIRERSLAPEAVFCCPGCNSCCGQPPPPKWAGGWTADPSKQAGGGRLQGSATWRGRCLLWLPLVLPWGQGLLVAHCWPWELMAHTLLAGRALVPGDKDPCLLSPACKLPSLSGGDGVKSTLVRTLRACTCVRRRIWIYMCGSPCVYMCM